MRTNIVLDDSLVKKAFRLSHVNTKKDLVNLALEEFVRNHSRLDLRDIKAKMKFKKDYDYKKMREGTP